MSFASQEVETNPIKKEAFVPDFDMDEVPDLE